MRIGIFSEVNVYNPPFPSGVARFFREITTELARRGHEVFIFEPIANKPQLEKIKDGITVYRAFSIPLGNYLNIPVCLPLKEIFFDHHIQLDIVHANSSGIGVLAGMTSYRQKIPRMISYHTPLIQYTSYAPLPFFFIRSVQLVNFLERMMYNQFNLTMVPTQGVKKALSDRGFKGPFGFFPTSLDLQSLPKPSPHDQELFKQRYNLSDKKVILFVGRMSPEKGIDQILQLVPAIVKEEPRAHFLMVGTGPLIEKYKKINQERNLTKYVTFTGYLSDFDLFTAISIARMGLIFVNQAQIFDMAILEYWHYGLPLIIRKAMGIEEVVTDNKNGLLFSSLTDAKNKILTLLQNDQLAKNIRTNCKLEVQQKYDIKKSIVILEKLYERSYDLYHKR